MPRFLLVLPLLFLAVSVAHAETYTRTVPSTSMGKYSLEQTWQQGSCYELGIATYASQSDCQTALQNINTSNTTIDSCGQINKSTYTYSFPGPACSDVLADYGLKLQGGGASGSTAAGTGGATGGNQGGGASAGDAGTLQNPLNNINSLPELLDTILKALVELGSILLVVMLVWVGFLFVSAQGNAEKLSTAKAALTWTVIGGLILLGAEAISQVIQATVKSL